MAGRKIIGAGKVTYRKADRVILAIVALMECDDFREIAAKTDSTNPTGILDRAADLARAMRDQAAR